MLGEPRRGSPVQLAPLARGEAGAHDVGEERVVAVPLASLVEGQEEQVRALEGRKHLRTVAAPGHRIAQRGAEPL